MNLESAHEAIKAAPPISAGGLIVLGIPLNEWVLIGTGVYTLFLLIEKFPTVLHRLGSGVRWLKGRMKKDE